MITQNLPTLKIHQLTDEQYKRVKESEDYDPNALYLTPDGGGNSTIDLTGYATEEWVQEEFQPKGEYLTEVPEGYAKTADIPSRVSQLTNDKGYLTEHQDISGKLDVSALPSAINTALTQAKESGQFDGADGKDGQDGKDGAPGEKGDPGEPGVDGADYVLTDADKSEIAEMAAALVDAVLLAIIGTGVVE